LVAKDLPSKGMARAHKTQSLMPSEKPEVRMWSFPQTPREFQTLFRQGKDSDWVAHVPKTERQSIESSLLQWRPVYPVQSIELEDRSVVYHGAPRMALELLTEHSMPGSRPLPPSQERRTGIRLQVAYPSRYMTPTQVGFGHTVDISRTGIAFTTETLLARNTGVTLRMRWPVRLEGGVPVEFHAVGKLARTEPTKAAMKIDGVSFSIEK
jgi:hypothetical protein